MDSIEAQAKTHIQLDDEMENDQDLSLLHEKYVSLADAQQQIQRQITWIAEANSYFRTKNNVLEGRLERIRELIDKLATFLRMYAHAYLPEKLDAEIESILEGLRKETEKQ